MEVEKVEKRTIAVSAVFADKIRQEAKDWGLADWVYIAVLRQVAQDKICAGVLSAKLMAAKANPNFTRKAQGRPIGSTKKLISSPPA